MKTTTFKSLGLNVNVSVPSDATEFDSLAKKSGACVEEAVRNVVYRGTLAEFRDILLHGRKVVTATDTTPAVEGITGMDEMFKIERKTKPTLDKDGKPKKNAAGEELTAYDESEQEFFDRIVATHGITATDQQKLADVVNAALTFDPSASERKPAAPKKLPAKYSDIAKKILEGGKIDALNTKLNKALSKSFTATGDTAKDVESLGWLVKEYSDWNEQQSMNKLVA